MAAARLLAVFLLSSSLFLGFCHGRSVLHVSIRDGLPPCLQKILPCEPYLKTPTNPPASCCMPLKQMILDDQLCLCTVFNNPSLLRALNVTQTEALQLPKACGAVVDPSKCQDVPAPVIPNPTPVSPGAGKEAPPAPPSKPSSSSRINPAHGLGYGFAALACFFVSHLF